MNVFEKVCDAIGERQANIYLTTGRELTPVEWSNLLAGQIGQLNNAVKIHTMREANFPGNHHRLTDDTLKTTFGTTIADCYIYLELLADSIIQSIPDSLAAFDKNLVSFEGLSIWLDYDKAEIDKDSLECTASQLAVASGALIDLVLKRQQNPIEQNFGIQTEIKRRIVVLVVGIARICKKASLDLPFYIENAFNLESERRGLLEHLNISDHSRGVANV